MIQGPRFVTTHSTLSPKTVLMENYERTPSGCLSFYNPLDVTECDVKLSDFKLQFPSEVQFMFTCNGLILTRFQKRYYVQNPITRRRLLLPEFSSHMLMPESYTSAILAFQASSKVYKVLAAFIDTRCDSYEHAILTVGVDKAWRPLPHLSQVPCPDERFTMVRISVPGFIYFALTHGTSYIDGLGLESETVNSISYPYVCNLFEKSFIVTGDCISLWYHKPDFSMEVWVLKDYKTEEWVKILCIEGEPIRNEWENLCSRYKLPATINPQIYIEPQSWLANDEKIFFSMAEYCLNYLIEGSPMNPSQSNGHFFWYDLNTHVCTEVNMKSKEFDRIIPFINTLVWV